MMRRLLVLLAIVFGGLALTVVMGGVWAWIENRMHLDAVGPNGHPALWCYFLVWGLLAVFFWPRRR